MANLYLLPRLLALCVRRLHSDMDINTVGKIYHCAGLAGQRGLQQTALHFMFDHFGAVVRTDHFRELPQHVLFQLWDEMPRDAAVVGGFGNGLLNNSQQQQDNHMSDTEDDEEEDDDPARPDSPMEA